MHKWLTIKLFFPIIRIFDYSKSQILFAESNLELSFDDDFYDEVVDKAINAGTGTRALNSIVKMSLSSAAFEYLGVNNQERVKIKVTKETVLEPSKYILEGWAIL